MKTRYSLILALLLVINAHGQIDDLQLEFEQYTLENGLEVILQSDPTVKNVSVEFWLRDGISYDQPNQYGLAHFFEHVMPFQPIDSIENVILKKYRKGSNAQVRKDFSRFYQEVDPKALNLLLKVAAGRLKINPEVGITRKRVEFQRKRVLAEIERNAKNPQWSALGSMAIYQGTFGKNHPYGFGGYGLIENNKKFQLNEFRERYKDIVHANNIILFVVGNFNPTEIKKQIDLHFKNIPSKSRIVRAIPPTSHSGTNITMRAPSPNDSINSMVLSWAIPNWGSHEDGALKLIATVLNQRFKTENDFQKLVLKSGAYTDMFAHAGQFSVRVQFFKKKDSTHIERLVLHKVKQLLSEEISRTELITAKQRSINDIAEMQHSLGFQWSRTELLGESFLFTGDPDFYFKRLKKQQQLQPIDLKKVAETWLKTAPCRILFLGN